MNQHTIKLTIILFIGLSISAITSCNSETAKPYYLISDEFADYCFFREGSSWVFQNDSTLVSDSVVISEIIESKRYASTPTQHHYQAVDMFPNSNVFEIARYEITAGSSKVESGEMNSLLRIYFEDGRYQIVFSPEYPFGEEIIMGDDIGVYENVGITMNYELHNRTYSEVWHTRVVVSNSIEYNYWIAKNHGLIKTVTTTENQTTSISLVESSLIPWDQILE